MIDTFNFLNQDFIQLVAIAGFVLWAVFIWKEGASTLKSKFYLNVLVALVSLISLAMIALKPLVWSKGNTGSGVLLTEGYQKENLDSLKKEYKKLKFIPYKANKPINEVLDSVSSMFVLGNGVKSYDFWQLQNIPTKYVGDIIPQGIVKLNYQNELPVGEELIVRGSYNTPQKEHYLLLADSSGKEIDSVLMDGSERSNFELSTDLKVKGKYVYKILEKDSFGNTISTEPLPIKVLPKEKLRVLMVNGFPTFESKYLKNFLAETGHELTVRNQLTRGKFKFEYFNTERRPFYSFTQKYLETIDLMIIDASSYTNLSKNSIQTIVETTQINGLGVLILPDASFFRLSINTSKFDFLNDKTSKVKWDKWPSQTWEKYPYVFKTDSRLEEVHHSDKMILTAYRRNGNGRIGTTVIQNSYQILLNGNSEAYHRFWSEIISVLSKRLESTSDWTSSSRFAFENEPFSFNIRTSEEKPHVVDENGRIPLMQNPDIRELWSGTVYPRRKGWDRLVLKNDSTAILDFYVIDSTEWKSITTFKTIMENKRQFNSTTNIIAGKKALIPMNQFWFYLIFILGMGYLWLAPKLFQN